jgi:hypothetical protein
MRGTRCWPASSRTSFRSTQSPSSGNSTKSGIASSSRPAPDVVVVVVEVRSQETTRLHLHELPVVGQHRGVEPSDGELAADAQRDGGIVEVDAPREDDLRAPGEDRPGACVAEHEQQGASAQVLVEDGTVHAQVTRDDEAPARDHLAVQIERTVQDEVGRFSSNRPTASGSGMRANVGGGVSAAATAARSAEIERRGMHRWVSMRDSLPARHEEIRNCPCGGSFRGHAPVVPAPRR